MKILWFRLWLGTCDEFKIEAIIEALLRQQEIFEIFVDDEVISRIFCEFYRACSALNEDRCSKCGCFVTMKASWAAEECPIQKWSQYIATKGKCGGCGRK